MTLRPLQDRVIAKPVSAETEINGIIIPDSAQDRPSKAVVAAVGPGARDQNGLVHPVPVKAGDTILFSKFGGMAVDLDGEEFLVLREGDILGVYDA